MKLDKLTTIRLFEGHNDKLELIAKDQGLNKADILRRAVKEYLERVGYLNVEASKS